MSLDGLLLLLWMVLLGTLVRRSMFGPQRIFSRTCLGAIWLGEVLIVLGAAWEGLTMIGQGLEWLGFAMTAWMFSIQMRWKASQPHRRGPGP